ncbi:AraC family transcriptional regulator [bacterium]|nr:AraC family transcriptional regulator [bacterium]MCI0605249.1 AraC family transcriptional regulator [bacterium]
MDRDTVNRLSRAREFMNDSYQLPLNLDQIAKEACFSQYHFLRLFRQLFQETPHQYLTRRRIEKAKELLQGTRRSVTDICFEVGFQSLGSFSTLFHRMVGNSPLSYRVQIVVRKGILIPECFIQMWKIPLGRAS